MTKLNEYRVITRPEGEPKFEQIDEFGVARERYFQRVISILAESEEAAKEAIVEKEFDFYRTIRDQTKVIKAVAANNGEVVNLQDPVMYHVISVEKIGEVEEN